MQPNDDHISDKEIDSPFGLFATDVAVHGVFYL